MMVPENISSTDSLILIKLLLTLCTKQETILLLLKEAEYQYHDVANICMLYPIFSDRYDTNCNDIITVSAISPAS